MIARLLDVGGREHLALIGFLDVQDEQPVGGVRMVQSTFETSGYEFSLTVLDEHQGRGFGTVLLGAIAAIALRLDRPTLGADVLATNRPMLELLRKVGAESRTDPGDATVVHAEVDVAAAASVLSDLDQSGLAALVSHYV